MGDWDHCFRTELDVIKKLHLTSSNTETTFVVRIIYQMPKFVKIYSRKGVLSDEREYPLIKGDFYASITTFKSSLFPSPPKKKLEFSNLGFT
jgi:hypothetical protein